MLTNTQQQQRSPVTLEQQQRIAHAALFYLPEAKPARDWLERLGIVPAIWHQFRLGYLPEVAVPNLEKVVMPVVTIPWIVGRKLVTMRAVFLEPLGKRKFTFLGSDIMAGVAYGGHALTPGSCENKTLLLVDSEINAWVAHSVSQQTNLDVLAIDDTSMGMSDRFYAKVNEYWQVIFWTRNQPLLDHASQYIKNGYAVDATGKPTPLQLSRKGQLGSALARIRLQAARTDEHRQALLDDLLHAAQHHPLGISKGPLTTLQRLATRFVQREPLTEMLPGRYLLGAYDTPLPTAKTVFPLVPEKIPAQLTEIPQWVGYHLLAKENAKTDKIPKNPHTGGNAAVTYPGTWADFMTALDFAYHTPDVDGIALVLTGQDKLVVVDIDDCVQDDGTLTDFAQEVVTLLDSYSEISPSGRGIHIYLFADMPGERHRSQSHGIELYDANRFMTVTGYHLPLTPSQVNERNAELAQLYTQIFGDEQPVTTLTPQPSLERQDVAAEDEPIWQQIFDGHKGQKLRSLFEGDVAVSKSDHSQAVIDLGNALAHYTNSDPKQMRRMFYQTDLMRPKWHEQRGEQLWIDYQIQDCIRYMADRNAERNAAKSKTETQ